MCTPGTGSQCAAGSQCACCGPRAPVVKWLARAFPASARVHGSEARAPCIARAPCARPHAAYAMLAAAGRSVAAGPRLGRPGTWQPCSGRRADAPRARSERCAAAAQEAAAELERLEYASYRPQERLAGSGRPRFCRKCEARRPRGSPAARARLPALSGGRRRCAGAAERTAPTCSRAVRRISAAAQPVRAARGRAARCVGAVRRLRTGRRRLQSRCDHAPWAAGP